MADVIILTREQIRDGYEKTVASALHLLEAGMSIAPRYSAPALGLAELGQEELGKSLSLLAAYAFPWCNHEWQWFWSGWRDHSVKAHRAFRYELISPTRIETRDADGVRIAAGLPFRSLLPHEKEAAFYVNFDEGEARFQTPFDAVQPLETFNRCFTLLYLAVTADCTRRALTAEDDDFRLRAFSPLAYRLCTDDLLQSDMPYVFHQFSALSSRHHELVAALNTEFEKGRAFISSCLPGSRGGA